MAQDDMLLQSLMAFEPQNEQEESDKQAILWYAREFPQNILTRSNAIAHITSSGLVLNEGLDQVLMVHHNIYKTWAWTGGHADGQEDLLSVALKEAQEETGIVHVRPLMRDMASLDVLPVWGHWKRGKYVSAHLHLNASYALVASQSDTLYIKQDENSGVRWIAIDRLEEFSNEPELIAVYRKIIARARGFAEGAGNRG